MLMLLALGLAAAGPADTALDAAHAAVGDEIDLVVERVVAWPGGSVVRLEQRVQGLPVIGHRVIVSLDPSGTVRRVRGAPARTRVDPVPDVLASDAIAGARAAIAGVGSLWPGRASLAVADRLVWRVELSTARPTATWRALVDAHTGEVLAIEPTSHSVLGRVYETNPILGEPIEVELAELQPGDELVGSYADVWSCDVPEVDETLFGPSICHEATRHAGPNRDGDYLFDPDPGSDVDPFLEVQLFHHVEYVAAWFDDRYGLRYDAPLRVLGNFGMSNAFFGDFDGDGAPDLAFGTTPGGVDFGYDADVAYHEFGHAVVAALADIPFLSADSYGLEWAGGSLNEGTADVFSMALTGDGLTGEYAGSGFGRPAIRDLRTLRGCPDDLRGEVHADGEVWAALGWSLIDHPDVGPDAVADLMVGAVATWDMGITWASAGASLADAAADLRDAGGLSEAGYAAVLDGLQATGVAGCGRIVSLDDNQSRSFYLLNLGLRGDFAHIPLGVGLSLDVPADATHMELRIRDFSAGDPGMGWTVYARHGAPVEHDPVTVAAFGIGTATATVYDVAVDGNGPDVPLTLRADTVPPLQPGTWYFAVASRNDGTMELLDVARGTIRISARSWTEDEEEPRGGCACGTRSGPGWLLLAGGVALFRRRRQPGTRTASR